MIEFTVGRESHTSYWGEYYIKGLESYAVREDHDSNRTDNHHGYQFFMADAPAGTVFTIFERNGDKRGTSNWIFSICVVEGEKIQEDQAEYGSGFCTGNYRCVAIALGKIKAPRMLGWWKEKPADADPLAYAEHCAVWIEKRGIQTLPKMEEV